MACLRLWRVGPFTQASATAESGQLWIPLSFQGDGRHDNPGLNEPFDAAVDRVAPIVEALTPFRGSGLLTSARLRCADRPLVLVEIGRNHATHVVDLDDPAMLFVKNLRPSTLTTRLRRIVDAQASRPYRWHADAVALK